MEKTKKEIHYTKEQINRLEELGVIQNFMTATVSDYKRGTLRKQDETVADIYEQATGTKVNRNFGCSVCCFRLYRDAGTLYYSSKDYWKRVDEERMRKAREAKEKKKQEQKPDVVVKDGTITFNFERALQEEQNNKEIKENNDENKDSE